MNFEWLKFFKLSGSLIHLADAANLGVVFVLLSLTDYANEISKSSNVYIHDKCRIKHYVHRSLRIYLTNALVLSHLHYSNSHVGITKSSMLELQTVQNSYRNI